jgi:hypothetical protein
MFFRTVALAIVVGISALLIGCGGHPSAGEEYPVWWSPSLGLTNLSDIHKRFQEEFWSEKDGFEVYKDKARLTEKTTMNDCLSLIKLYSEGYRIPARKDEEFYFYRDLDMCHALKMLKEAKPAKRSYLNDFRLNAEALNFLPAILDRGGSCDMACREHAANDKGVPWSTWLEAVGEDVVSVDVISPYEMTVSTEITRRHVEILARADFNDDGLEDLIVWGGPGAAPGSRDGTLLYTLSRETPNSVLRVLDADNHLCLHYQCRERYDEPEILR